MTNSGRCWCSATTRRAVLWCVDQAQRTMCSGSVNTVRSGGSMLPFHSTCRHSRRRTVRRTTRRITAARLRSSHTSRSARPASRSRTVLYCHSVIQFGSALKASTSAANVSRGVQPGPWNKASISTCGMASSSPMRTARVVLPAAEVPPRQPVAAAAGQHQWRSAKAPSHGKQPDAGCRKAIRHRNAFGEDRDPGHVEADTAPADAARSALAHCQQLHQRRVA